VGLPIISAVDSYVDGVLNITVRPERS